MPDIKIPEEIKKKLTCRNPSWGSLRDDRKKNGKPLCGNPLCDNISRFYKNNENRFRLFCSVECNDIFLKMFDWNTIAEEVISKNPICEECKVLPSFEVHHIIPVSIDPTLQYDRDNLTALCEICHKGKREWVKPTFRHLKRAGRSSKECRLFIKFYKNNIFKSKKILVWCLIYYLKINKRVFRKKWDWKYQLVRYKNYNKYFGFKIKQKFWYRVFKVKTILDLPIDSVGDVNLVIKNILKYNCHRCPDILLINEGNKKDKKIKVLVDYFNSGD